MDKLEPIKEKLEPLLEKVAPLLEKLGPLKEKIGEKLENQCLKCKSEDVEPAELNNKVEELLNKFFPIAPYDCGECEARYFWLTNPLMDRTRAIVAGSLGGLFMLLLLFNLMGGPEEPVEQVAEEPTMSELAQKYDTPLDDEPPLASADEPEDAPTDVEPAVGIPPEEEGPPPGTVPEPGEVWSDRVHAQLARNLAKARGEAVPEPKPKGRKSRSAAQNPPLPAGARISALESDTSSAAFSLKVNTGTTTAKPKGFAIGNTKYVVDLPGAWNLASSVKDFRANHSLVAGVRVGKHADYVRLVFDFAKAATVKVSYNKEGQRLVIQLSE